MAAGGLLAVLDDITMILDDVAAMSKIAARKTAGLIGDDLAVNANVVVGLNPSRELPIVGKIALGSLANKAVIIPLALVLPSSVIGPLLMFGGAFLCYEAVHKIVHPNEAKQPAQKQERREALLTDPDAAMRLENEKVRGAIGTDAILSAEVIAIALGSVAAAPFATKALTLVAIGLAMTLGVYGLVAVIVKVDDVGLHLQTKTGENGWARFVRGLGRALVAVMPKFMKLLSIAGTLAMFTVGGGILLHGIPGAESWIKATIGSLTSLAPLASALELFVVLLFGALVGLAVLPVVGALGKLASKFKPAS